MKLLCESRAVKTLPALYLSILALNAFYVSDRYTLSAYLGIDPADEQLNS